MRDIAKKDLGVPTGAARKVLVFALVVLGLLIAAAGTYRWHARRWPFSTGTGDSALLGATFGMSPQEAERALLDVGARLVSYDEFRAMEHSTEMKAAFELSNSSIPVFSDNRQAETRRYMPSIEMFASAVTAELVFRDSRLTAVEVVFHPLETSQSKSVVVFLENALKAQSDLVGREESQVLKGAYWLRFTHSSVIRSLWVNLTKPERPIVRLHVWRSTEQDDRTRAVEVRQKKAFGSR